MARALFIASAYTGISPAEYSAQFDTVYVSLWKYFNCGIGAILAGPKRVLDGMFHVRRMFGGNLAVGWNAALVARHFMDGFEGRLKSAVQISETFYAAMAKHPRLAHRTHSERHEPHARDLQGRERRRCREAARRARHRDVGPAGPGTITFGVNETWNRMSAADLIRAFEQARLTDLASVSRRASWPNAIARHSLGRLGTDARMLADSSASAADRARRDSR